MAVNSCREEAPPHPPVHRVCLSSEITICQAEIADVTWLPLGEYYEVSRRSHSLHSQMHCPLPCGILPVLARDMWLRRRTRPAYVLSARA